MDQQNVHKVQKKIKRILIGFIPRKLFFQIFTTQIRNYLLARNNLDTVNVWTPNMFGFWRSKICLIPKQSQFQTLSKIRTKTFRFRKLLNVWNPNAHKKVVWVSIIWVFIVVTTTKLKLVIRKQELRSWHWTSNPNFFAGKNNLQIAISTWIFLITYLSNFDGPLKKRFWSSKILTSFVSWLQDDSAKMARRLSKRCEQS